MSHSSLLQHSLTFQLTSVGNASAQFVTTYTGTIVGGAANAYGGYTFVIAGFVNSANNGTFLCLQSTATTLLLVNFSGVAESHAATATSLQMLALGGTVATIGTFFPAGTSPQTVIGADPSKPIFFNPNGVEDTVNIGTFGIWTQAGDIEAPIHTAVNISPNSTPSFPFADALEANIITDPSYTGDATGCFLDALDINNSITSPAYFGQVYGILVENGMSLSVNGTMAYVDDFRRIYAETLNGQGPGTNSTYHTGRQIGFNCATGGFYGPQNGIVGLSWGMNFEGPRQGGGIGIWNSHQGIRMASQRQGSVLGSFTLTAASATSTDSTFTLTSVDASVNGFTTYRGSGITKGQTFFITMSGFVNAANNGTFFCIGNSATTLTIMNSAAISETHAATATITVNTYTGTFPAGGSNAFLNQIFNITGFVATGSALTLTSVDATIADSSSNLSLIAGQNGVAVYHGTITDGDDNAYVGRRFTVAGFATGANNGTFICIGSTRTTLTLGNANASAEIHAATAAPQSNNGIFVCTASTTTTITVNNYLGAAEVHAGSVVARNGNAWAIHQDDSSDRNALGTIYLGGDTGAVLQAGSGSPEGLITSAIGGTWFNTGGVSGTSHYVKESGTGNTGWIPLRNASLNAQSGTSYTILDGDRGKRITFSNTAATAITLPQANASTFVSGWYAYVQNTNTGIVTITPTTSTINGFTSIQLFQWQWAVIFSDGTNYQAQIQPFASNDNAPNLSTYLTNDAGTAAGRNQIITRNINTGVNSNRKGMNVYFEHDGATTNVNYDGFQVNTGFTVDAFTNKVQAHTDGTEIVALGAIMNATFTSVANASAGTTVYTGTIQNGANNGAVGLSFIVTGFVNGANNGTFQATASTATTLTLNNAGGVAETHAGAGVVASLFTLTSVANHSGSATVYTGTIPGGGSNFYSGWSFRILGFTNSANNGLFPCTASTTTTLTLTNANGTAETHAATAAWMVITEINVLKLRWGASQNGNILNNTGILQYLPAIAAGSTVDNFSGHVIDAPTGGGAITSYTGITGGTNLNALTVQNAVGVSGFFIDATVTNCYGGVFSAKSGSVLADDGGTVARSFIGHANLQIGPPFTLHDGWYGATGSPEGVVTAAVGSMFSQQNGTPAGVFFIKTQGSGNTGWGAVPSRVAVSDLTAQTAAVAATTIYAVPASAGGFYRISYNAKVTTAGTTSTLGGTNGFQVVYTDNDDSVVVTTPAWWGGGNNGAAPTSASLNTTQTQVSGVIIVNAKASTNIQFSFDYTSSGTAMQYSLHTRVIAVG